MLFPIPSEITMNVNFIYVIFNNYYDIALQIIKIMINII